MKKNKWDIIHTPEYVLAVDAQPHREINTLNYLPDGSWAVAYNTNEIKQQKGVSLDVRWHYRIMAHTPLNGKPLEGVWLLPEMDDINNKVESLFLFKSPEDLVRLTSEGKMWIHGCQIGYKAAGGFTIVDIIKLVSEKLYKLIIEGYFDDEGERKIDLLEDTIKKEMGSLKPKPVAFEPEMETCHIKGKEGINNIVQGKYIYE